LGEAAGSAGSQAGNHIEYHYTITCQLRGLRRSGRHRSTAIAILQLDMNIGHIEHDLGVGKRCPDREQEAPEVRSAHAFCLRHMSASSSSNRCQSPLPFSENVFIEWDRNLIWLSTHEGIYCVSSPALGTPVLEPRKISEWTARHLNAGWDG
jgi:hypothetical protein